VDLAHGTLDLAARHARATARPDKLTTTLTLTTVSAGARLVWDFPRVSASFGPRVGLTYLTEESEGASSSIRQQFAPQIGVLARLDVPLLWRLFLGVQIGLDVTFVSLADQRRLQAASELYAVSGIGIRW
jgi:hypothetical protein